MASFMFTGDPRGGADPPAVELFGLVFPRGLAVEVTDAMAIAKLAQNGHFRRCDGAAAAPDKPKRKRKDSDDAREG
jgi:hypothetical protein